MHCEYFVLEEVDGGVEDFNLIVPKKREYEASNSEGRQGLTTNAYKLFRTLEGRVCQRVLKISTDRALRKKTCLTCQDHSLSFSQIVPDKKGTSLKSFAFVSYPLQVALLNFSQVYKKRLI